MKTILVTGGSRGIGRAVALRAGGRGWSVAIGYRADRAAAEEVVAAVEAGGGRAVALRGDVASEDDVVATFDEAERVFGQLDGVVANAGITSPASPLAEMSAERMRRIVEVNVLGTLLCARVAARRLGTGGSLVLISSAAARLGSPDEYVDYAASKGALDTLCVGLAKELGAAGIRVNAVRPGIIETDIHATSGDPRRPSRLTSTIPLGRPGSADEVAAAIVWLLSDDASYTTGAILDVAGGR